MEGDYNSQPFFTQRTQREVTEEVPPIGIRLQLSSRQVGISNLRLNIIEGLASREI
jgi:hypothetical protein